MRQSLPSTLHHSHPEGLDHTLSGLVLCCFRLTESTQKAPREGFRILGHLPAQPLQLADLPTDFVHDFLVPDTEAMPWNNRRVTAYLSSNVVRAALLAISHSGIGMFAPLNDMTGDILELASQLSSHAILDSAKWRLFIDRVSYENPGNASK